MESTKHPWATVRGAALAVALGSLLAAGCGFQTEEFGNVVNDCPANTSCSCGTGNCVQGCSGGGCDLTCTGYSNCSFDCEGGGCTISCANTGNCFATCAGGGCDMTCTGTGNCGITECAPADPCSVTCAGTGNCI